VTRNLDDVLDRVVALAVDVGGMQVARRADVGAIGVKSHAKDLVSRVDLDSERRIVDTVHALWPDDAILAEEGTDRSGTSGWLWIVDPLDGTRSYLSGAGAWSVSIALWRDDTPVLGVVHDPDAGRTYTAVAGRGAALDGRPVRVSTVSVLARAVVCVAVNPSPETGRRLAPVFDRLRQVSAGVHGLSAALGMTRLAAGQLDCCLVADTRPWDVAAGELIAREAGAVVGGTAGVATHRLAVVAGPGVWAELAEALTPELGPVTRFSRPALPAR